MISISYNFSSNDFEFIEQCIREAKLISNDIHFSCVSKFFDGEEENKELINKAINICNSNGVSFTILEYDETLKNKITNKSSFFRYWHNITRLANTEKCINDYVLYLDGDEILDGERFSKWLESINLTDNNSYVFDAFWYFRNKKYQAKTWEPAGLLVNKKTLSTEDLMNSGERWGMIKHPYARQVRSIDGLPMVHHYSWAKGNSEKECQEMLLKKVKSWGHTSDRDWESLIKEEFSREFNGKDFVHGYSYNTL